MPWQIIALIILAVVLYVVADACFDVSKKLSRVFRGVTPLPFFGALSNLGAIGAKLGGLPWLRLAAIPLVIGVIWGVVAYIEDKGAGRERLRQAERVKVVLEHQFDVAALALKLGEETARDNERVAAIVTQANQEIENAVSQNDFDALFSAYDRAYRGVWNDGLRRDQPDPAPARPDRVPGSNASPV